MKTGKQEIEIMRELCHPHIVQLFADYEDTDHVYLVMEFCKGGRLIDFVAHQSVFTESDAAHLMGQVFSATKYIHDNGIIHRDMKPDNMLLDSWAPIRSNTLKLIDFGLSCRCAPGQVVRASVGTPEFVSPQAIDGRYDTQADMWSCGVSMFLLLCGYVPFSGSQGTIFNAVRRGNFAFATEEWRDISDGAKGLIRALLKMNPHERCTAEQALNHMWVQAEAPGASGTLHKTLRNFRMHSGRGNYQQPEATVFTNVQGVFNEVSQMANKLFLPAFECRNYSAAHENSLEISMPYPKSPSRL